MQIFQIDRFLLRRQISKNSSRIRGKVLDIGSGSTDRYGDLFETDTYIRMDIESYPGVTVVGSAEEIPFPESTFDGVICTQVLEHVLHPDIVMNEIQRVLKSGGNAIITVPQSSELHEEPRDFQRFTKYWMNKRSDELGFIFEIAEQRGGFFSLLHQQTARYCIDRFHLYTHRFLGSLMSHIFSITAQIALFLDDHDHSGANRKHTLGWLFVISKK